MKRKLRSKITVLLAAAFLVSGALILQQHLDYQAADQAYAAAQTIALQSPADAAAEEDPEILPEDEIELAPEPVPMVPAPTLDKPERDLLEESVRFLLELNLDALRQTNEDVLGWIYIPDTPIDYPLMRVKDNNEYLRRAWDGSANNAGCIFLECRNSHDFSDFNTLIYGHALRNGKMFRSLLNYREQEYRDSHPYVYIVTDEWVRRYEVFSAYEADVVSDTYRLVFEHDARKQNALDEWVEQSVLERELVPTVEDSILTLSTCTGTGTYETRWVVQAVLTGEFSR